jgi:hypothetical protein
MTVVKLKYVRKYLDVGAGDDQQHSVGEVLDKEPENDTEAVVSVQSLVLASPSVGHPHAILILVAH